MTTVPMTRPVAANTPFLGPLRRLASDFAGWIGRQTAHAGRLADLEAQHSDRDRAEIALSRRDLSRLAADAAARG